MQPRYLDFIIEPQPKTEIIIRGFIGQMFGAYWPGRFPHTRPIKFQFKSIKKRGLWNPGNKDLIAVFRIGEKIVKVKMLYKWSFSGYSKECDNILEFSPELWKKSDYFHGGKWAFNLSKPNLLDELDLL